VKHKARTPACGEDTARSLALSVSCEALKKISILWFVAINPSYAFWICCITVAGLDELARSTNCDSVDLLDWSPSAQTLFGRMACWSVSVVAADAKKAEGASI